MAQLPDTKEVAPIGVPGEGPDRASGIPDLFPERTPMSPVYATFWQRLGAHIVDHVALDLIVPVVGLVYYWIFVILFLEFHAGANESISYHDQEKFEYFIMGLLLVVFLVAFSYSVFFESSRFQATPGKLLFGLKVTDLSGNRISFLRASGRFLSKVFSRFFYIGYLIQPFTEHKQAIHDMMAETLVVER